MENKVIEIIADRANLNKEDIKMDSTFRELGFDSLDNIELIMDFEKHFDISIPDQDMERLITVGDAVKYLSINGKK